MADDPYSPLPTAQEREAALDEAFRLLRKVPTGYIQTWIPVFREYAVGAPDPPAAPLKFIPQEADDAR